VETWLAFLFLMPQFLVGVYYNYFPPLLRRDKFVLVCAWVGTLLISVASLLYIVPRAGWGNLLILLGVILAFGGGTYLLLKDDTKDKTPRRGVLRWDPLEEDKELVRQQSK
jgi:hypothetical protein